MLVLKREVSLWRLWGQICWGEIWGGPRPAIPWYLKTYRKHCYFQLKYTLVSPDSNNRIYTDFFSEQPHQVPVLIIDQEKTTPSTPYKKV